MHNHQPIKKIVEFGRRIFRRITQLPVGRRREVEGSTSAIRLQRPLVTIPDFAEKIKQKSSKYYDAG